MLRHLAIDPLDVTGLILDLIRERRSSGRLARQILLVGHSFGGTFLKQMFITAHPSNSSNPDLHLFHRSIRGFVFLGTPHHDLNPPDVSKMWRTLAAEAVKPLDGRSLDLQEALSTTFGINRKFQRLGGNDTPTLCFYENEKSWVGMSQASPSEFLDLS